MKRLIAALLVLSMITCAVFAQETEPADRRGVSGPLYVPLYASIIQPSTEIGILKPVFQKNSVSIMKV